MCDDLVKEKLLGLKILGQRFGVVNRKRCEIAIRILLAFFENQEMISGDKKEDVKPMSTNHR